MAAEYLARLGERLRKRREELGLTQEDVARQLPGKVTGQRVSLWERGEHRPRDDSLEALAGVLGVPVSYFLAPAPDKTETPDLVATMNGNGERSQLDRIEANQAEMADRLEKIEERLALIERAGLVRAGAALAQAQSTEEEGESPQAPARQGHHR